MVVQHWEKYSVLVDVTSGYSVIELDSEEDCITDANVLRTAEVTISVAIVVVVVGAIVVVVVVVVVLPNAS